MFIFQSSRLVMRPDTLDPQLGSLVKRQIAQNLLSSIMNLLHKLYTSQNFHLFGFAQPW